MRQQSLELDQNCAGRKEVTIITFLLTRRSPPSLPASFIPVISPSRTDARVKNEERERKLKWYCDLSSENQRRVRILFTIFSQILHPWMKVTVENKHPQLQIHTAHETHAADRCWLLFYLFYVNSPREIYWIEVIISAAGMKTLLMKQPRWKVTFVFCAFSCENSWSGNTALYATCWHLKELLCFINQIDWVYISK